MRIRMGCTNLETVSCFERDVEPYIKPFREAVGRMRGSHGLEPLTFRDLDAGRCDKTQFPGRHRKGSKKEMKSHCWPVNHSEGHIF